MITTRTIKGIKNGFAARALCLLVAAALFAAVLPAGVFAADTDRRVVKVGYYPLVNFQEYDDASGTYRGYSYDYMMAAAQYAGWKYEFVPVESYDAGIEMLENGDIDLMNGVEQSSDLSGKVYFSSIPSGNSCTCLDVNPDNTEVAFEDFESFANLTVGLDYNSSRNVGFIDYCKDNDCLPRLIYYHSEEEVEAAMENGEIDAELVSSLQDVGLRSVAKFSSSSYYFAVAKGNGELLKELNAAMNELKVTDPYFEEKIYSKYHANSADQQTVISESEKEYVKENPVVTVSYNPAWYPLAYKDGSGEMAGTMVSVFQMITDRTGLRFQFVADNTFSETLKDFAAGKTQMMAGFPYDYTWAARYNALVTEPFATFTYFAAYKSDAAQGNTVAVPRDSYQRYLSSEIRKDSYNYLDYNTMGQCLQAVLNGGADYAFLDSNQLEYYQEKEEFRGLSFKAIQGAEYRLSLAVSESADSRLYSILNKAIASAGSSAFSGIFRETSYDSGARSLLDLIYMNPRIAVIAFMILGFLIAAIIAAVLYSTRMREKNQQLSEAANAKSDFLSNISHDMRTPLNGIIGYTNLALEETGKSREKEKEYLDKIKISGEFLLNLINDTLDISKIESGKYELRPEVVDSEELLRGITVSIQSMADAKGVRFILDSGRAYLGYVRVDRLNTQKIVLNLLSNAVKFTPEGGTVSLTIEKIDPKVNKGMNCRVIVSDNGIGISEDFLPKLFEPFSQERAKESAGEMGTGLGLSIVKNLVEMMKGEIRVTSKRGEGSTFVIALPVEYVGESQAPSVLEATDASDLAGKRVLLCEDNEMNTEIAKIILEGFGMIVTTAPNGAKGAALFAESEEGGFDCVLMDLRMPVMDGYEATKSIRAMARMDASKVPIIALSADAFEDDRQKCEEAGMNGHVAKPVDREILLRELLKQMSKQRE